MNLRSFPGSCAGGCISSGLAERCAGSRLGGRGTARHLPTSLLLIRSCPRHCRVGERYAGQFYYPDELRPFAVEQSSPLGHDQFLHRLLATVGIAGHVGPELWRWMQPVENGEAIASRVLASPDSRVLGLIGAGSQAVTQLHALSREFQLEEVLVYDIDSEANASFAGRVAPLELGDLQIRNASLADVVRDADILCTATSVGIGAGPVLDDIELKPWVHINAVGSDFHGKTELPLSLLKRALVCPDFTAQALMEGECQQLHPDALGPDLVTLLREPGSFAEYRNKTTVFDSTGWAVEDHVITEILIKSAKALGIGTPVQIEGVCNDPKNPYGFLQDATRCLRDGQDVSRAVNTL